MKTTTIALLCGAASLLAASLPAHAQAPQGYWVRDYWIDAHGYRWQQDTFYAYASSQRRSNRNRVQQVQYSAVACDTYAINYARNASAEGEIFMGGAFGSLAGLGIGSLFAASGVGAAIGATAGIIGGGAVRNQREQQLYAAAYQDCMQGLVR